MQKTQNQNLKRSKIF